MKTWIFADYSQAEARVVAWKGPVPALKQWFLDGEDVHTNVARYIARYVQTNRIRIPRDLFMAKPWNTYGKEDEERQISKTTVHANNYGMGKRKFALITGLPEAYAKIVQEIYFTLFPEVRTGYQRGIEDQLRRNRTIAIPQGWHKVFYDMWTDDMLRAAYAFYAQSTVGHMLVRTLSDCCEFLANEGIEVWTPEAIRSQGLDVQLQIHDAIGVSIEDDPSTIEFACRAIRRFGEHPISINNEELVIPMDFKVGPSWGDATDYKLPR